MNPDRLLSEIQRVFEGTRDPAHVKRRLEAIANRPGAGEALARVLRTGDVVDAQLAALALPYATSQLVRRGLMRDAKQSGGGRRALLLSALTDEELARVFSELGEGDDDWLIEAMGLFAVNDPADFVDMLCESVPMVGLRMVNHVEKVRRTYAIPAAAMYGPLLGRKLSGEARARVLAILGHDPSDESAALLAREQTRVIDDGDKRTLRRERMRQDTLALQGVEVAEPEGLAWLSPVGPRDTAVLEILEDVGGGRSVATTVLLSMSGPAETFSRPLDVPLNEATRPGFDDAVELTLGQARWLLESLPVKRRSRLGPVLERLVAAPAQLIERPSPALELPRSDAMALAADPAFTRWRPLAAWVGWPDDVLEQPVDDDVVFPVDAVTLAKRVDAELARSLANQKMRDTFAAGLRHMALWLSLRGDPCAGHVGAEALRVARRRPGSLSFAMAERDLLLQRWSLGRLPEAFRQAVRDRVRAFLAVETVGWDDVALLDLAQAATEGLARSAGFARGATRLTVPGDDEIEVAVGVARRALASLKDKPLQQALRTGRLASLAEEARGWLEGAPLESAFQLVQFVSATCLNGCPHDCLRRKPRRAPLPVFRGPCPRPP